MKLEEMIQGGNINSVILNSVRFFALIDMRWRKKQWQNIETHDTVTPAHGGLGAASSAPSDMCGPEDPLSATWKPAGER